MITDHEFVWGPGGFCVQFVGTGADREWCGCAQDRHASPAPETTEAQRNSPAFRAWEETHRQREVLAGGIDKRPHSRACGITRHDHGPACSSNCPTCHGKESQPPVPFTPYAKAVQKVVDAWEISGPHVVYHKEMQKRLRLEWPVLANAIEDLIKEIERT